MQTRAARRRHGALLRQVRGSLNAAGSAPASQRACLGGAPWSAAVCLLWLGALMGCGAPPPKAIWIGGDVQVTRPTAERFAVLATIEGIGIVNLEGPVGRPSQPVSATHLVNDPRVPALLVRHGAGVIGLANNHREDLGPAGVQASVDGAREVGARPADRGQPAELMLGSDRVRVVAGEVADLEQMRAELRAPADLRIASLHVLAPPSYLPSQATHAAVDSLLAAGADVVAVHGSHALGPVERRGGAIIAWGLGNLAFDCACTQEDEALILRIWRTGGRLDAEVIPIRAGLGGRPIERHPDAAGIMTLLQGLGSHVGGAGRVWLSPPR